jgi:hypothetical protein
MQEHSMATDTPTGQAMTGPPPLGWLLISVSTAGAPASLRTQVWRRLRSLGALYLQQSVCLLPDRPEVARAVRRLLDRVHRDGGQGRLLRVVLPQPAEQAAVIAEFQAARGATYAEVEESEADLERFRSWLAKIAARDYFGAPRGPQAQAAVERCAQALAAFEAAALATEAPDPSPAPQHVLPEGRLRLATPED